VDLRSLTKKLIEAVLEGGGVPKRYRTRPCQGRAWRRAFPDATSGDIRAFLLLFTAAFAYREREKLKFRPDDVLMQIYRTHYPSKWMADALELETFALYLEKRYGILLANIWRSQLTLGQVFVRTRNNDA